MNTLTPTQVKSLEIVGLHGLADGIDTQKLDAFLDQAFELVGAVGTVVCTLMNDRVLRLQSRETILQELEMPLAKTKLRMLCARLAVRCSEWSHREVSPYGDVVDVEFPLTNQRCKVSFENTPASQKFVLEDNSTPRPSETAPAA